MNEVTYLLCVSVHDSIVVVETQEKLNCCFQPLFSSFLTVFRKKKTTVMSQFSAVNQIAVVISDFRTITLAIISNAS